MAALPAYVAPPHPDGFTTHVVKPLQATVFAETKVNMSAGASNYVTVWNSVAAL